MIILDALEQDFNFSAALLVTEQASRNHARVIEYQEVTRMQELGQLAKRVVTQLILVAVHA